MTLSFKTFRHWVLGPIALAGLFGLLAWCSIMLTRGDGRVAAIWLPNALLVAVLLRSDGLARLRFFPPAYAANVLAAMIAGDPAARALGTSLANSVAVGGIWLGMLLARYPRPDFANLRHLVAFSGIAGVICPLIGGAIGASVLLQTGAIQNQWVSTWLNWSLIDGLSMLIAAPTLLILYDAAKVWRRPTRAVLLEWAVVSGLSLMMLGAVFFQNSFPLLFLIYPVILLSAFRLGMSGTALSIIWTAAIAMIATTFDAGPISLVKGSFSDKLLILQLLLVTCFGMGLPVAAGLAVRRQLSNTLQRQVEFNDMILENMQDVIFISDARGRWEFLSPAWTKLTGLSVEESLGQPSLALLHTDDLVEAAEFRRQVLAGEIDACVFERRLVTPAGVCLTIEATQQVLRDGDGNYDGVVGNLRDISIRKQALEAVEASEQRFREATHLAEQALLAKSRFLANMSHEIRTPMNGVLGFTQQMLEGNLDIDQRRRAELIAESGKVMMQLLNDILDLSKIEAGMLSITPEPLDLAHCLKRCVRLLSPIAEQKGLALTCAVATDIPSHVLVDGLRVQQVVLNLLGNALKFTETGFVAVRASWAAPGQLAIEVADSGVGIAPDRHAAVFQIFTQADSSTVREFGGSGLGLSISRKLAQLMGGDIALTSTPGRGSTFVLQIPADRAYAAAAAAQDLWDQHTDRRQDARVAHVKRVLVAEDHDINQLLIADILTRLQIEYAIAPDGAQAIALIEAAASRNEQYDLVLMDMQMPVMDGLQATRAIRARGHAPEDLPIIALTANAYPDDIASCIAAGMQAHLAKPVSSHDIDQVLRRWCPRADGPARSSPGLAAQPVRLPAEVTLQDRYAARKAETLEFIAQAIAAQRYSAQELSEISRMAHQLAGTAGMFGEDALGEHARELERGLAQWDSAARDGHLREAYTAMAAAA